MLVSLHPEDMAGWFETDIFWDVQGCPCDISTLGSDLISKGYTDNVLIRPYIGTDYEGAVTAGNYRCTPEVVIHGENDLKVMRMLLDIVFWAMNYDDVPQNLMMLFSKPSSKDTKCERVLQALERRGFNVILRPCAEIDTSTIVSFEQLCEEKPTNQSVNSLGRSVESERLASQPVLVFWLVDDCPPKPSETWYNVMSTLRAKGYPYGAESMTAYGSKSKISKEIASDYHNAGVIFKTLEEESEKITFLALDMIDSADLLHWQPANFLLTMVCKKPLILKLMEVVVTSTRVLENDLYYEE
ncbi:uncharacterized protein LOC18028876 isoform X2 [Eutrema salsugineum]|uniref:uncharacterized protein LOC18028877 isoform X2 n=1 Tax=Eutrema salsugineum TaxID=72664 RepID=UPI000CECF0B9|nr:uncharacterized protein LOC18028877 isoform X2 [Eutrema salsugineum]XP_024005885.1 uncharacterized protein LOC18028876 isoform X2 [Eutrema salsugineum]